MQRRQQGGNTQQSSRGRIGKTNGISRGRGTTGLRRVGGRNSFNQRNTNRSNRYGHDINCQQIFIVNKECNRFEFHLVIVRNEATEIHLRILRVGLMPAINRLQR
jgi:hypothetical protein